MRWFTTQAARITELQTKVQILERVTAQADMRASDAQSSLEARMATLEMRLSELEGRVDAAESKPAVEAKGASTLETRLSELEGRVAAAESKPAVAAKSEYGSLPEPAKGV